MVWSLQDAKNNFFSLVERALAEGPQRVTRHGKDAVVVVSAREWARLQGSESSLADFLLNSPLAGSSLEIIRDAFPVRAVEL